MPSLSRALALACVVLLACAPSGRRGDDTGGDGTGDTGGGGTTTTGHSCRQNTDCASTPAQPVCDTSAGHCVACLTDQQCPENEVCKHDGLCHGTQACTTDDSCPVIDHCASDGFCALIAGRCAVDQDCGSASPTPRCDSGTGTCVACESASDCGGFGVGTCTANHTCQLQPGRCLKSSDCDQNGGTPVCNTDSKVCVGCLSNDDCSSGLCEEGQCAALGSCTTDQNCVHVSGKPHCSTNDQCVQCTGNNQCASGQVCQNFVCHTTSTGGCGSGPACSGQTPYCVSGTCVECTSNTQCATGETCSGYTCQGGTTGSGACYAMLTCINNCADDTCANACYTNASATAQNDYNALANCILTVACPNTGGGVCDSTSASYNQTNCDNCQTSSVQGTCASEWSACTTD